MLTYGKSLRQDYTPTSLVKGTLGYPFPQRMIMALEFQIFGSITTDSLKYLLP